MFSKLLLPAKIGTMTCKNRVIMAPMGCNFALEGGGVSTVQINYYRERARGGVGLIIVENANVDFPMGANGATQLRIDHDRFIPGLSHLAEAIREAGPGCKVALQINHGGGTAKSARIGAQPIGPSDICVNATAAVPRPMTKEEIEELAIKFGEAAFRAKRAGFDAIELHGGYAYLLGQFISPYTNRRTDEYGGSVENRMRFPLMIIQEIRKRVGPQYPFLFRMNGEEFMEGALTLEQAKEGAQLLEKASVNLLHITAGNGLTAYRHIEPMSFTEGWKVYLAKEIKKMVTIPVAAVGVIREPSQADEIISQGIDFVAIGRGLIADPYWVKKAEQGHPEQIRKCISCLVCASKRIYEDLPVRCSVNPMVGHESEGKAVPPQGPAKKVVVVGGGPAGMQAAILAAQKGHKVTLVEKKKVLGGQLLLAMIPPHKDKIKWFIDYLIGQLEQTKAEVYLGVEATPELIKKMEPDTVIVATGSQPITLFMDKAANAVTAHTLLEKGLQVKDKKVVVIGGGLVGCECAEYLARQGNKVTVLEMLPGAAADVDVITRIDLFNRLKEMEVDILTSFQVKEVNGTKVIGRFLDKDASDEKETEAELLVVAIGSRADNVLAQTLAGTAKQILTIGDCSNPSRIVQAVRQATVAVENM